eukprot:10548715-Heterocapsa_arctica.AAC.1
MSSSDSRLITVGGPCLLLALLALFSSGVSLSLFICIALLAIFAFANIFAAASSELVEFPSSLSSSDTT